MVNTVIAISAIGAVDIPPEVRSDNCFGGDIEQPQYGSTPKGWVSVEDLGDTASRPLDDITDIGPDDSEPADIELANSDADWDRAVAAAMEIGCYSASPRTPNHAPSLDQARSSAQVRTFVPAPVDLYSEPLTDVSGINYLSGSPASEDSDRWDRSKGGLSMRLVLTQAQLAALERWNRAQPHRVPKRLARDERRVAATVAAATRFHELASKSGLTVEELVQAISAQT